MKSQSQPKRSSQNPQKVGPKTEWKIWKKVTRVNPYNSGVNPSEEKRWHLCLTAGKVSTPPRRVSILNFSKQTQVLLHTRVDPSQTGVDLQANNKRKVSTPQRLVLILNFSTYSRNTAARWCRPFQHWCRPLELNKAKIRGNVDPQQGRCRPPKPKPTMKRKERPSQIWFSGFKSNNWIGSKPGSLYV